MRVRITDQFASAHASFRTRLDALETLLAPAGVDVIADAVAGLAGPFLAHAEDEERVLFPALAVALGPDADPLEALRGEHRAIRGILDEIARRPSRRKLESDVTALLAILRQHMAMEERELFAVAVRVLGERRLVELEERRARLALEASYGSEL